MYLPYRPVTAQEDSIGNLQIWKGKNTAKPVNDDQIAYIQTSQDRETVFSACFDLTEENKEELTKGYSIVIYLHEDYVMDIFS